MATVSATPAVLSPCAGTPSPGGILGSDPLYIPTSTSPHPESSFPSPRISTTGLLASIAPVTGVLSGGLKFPNTPMSGDRVISTTTASTTSEFRMVDVHGVKVASFSVAGQDELICLPQVFELFLKHLVGGLHTVYTKLKRLDIYPVVCTVEQVRVLRGLGAIQPGVNRCKLISRRDFDALYNDCTNASSRPGRPSKHSAGGGIQESSRLLHPGAHGLLSPGMLSHTAAAMAELQKMKAMLMQGGGTNEQTNENISEDDAISSNTGGTERFWDREGLGPPPSVCGGVKTGMGGNQGLNCQMNSLQQHHLVASRLQDLPFVLMPHHLLPVGLPPVSVAMAMSQMNHLANMAATAQMHTHLHTHEGSGIQDRVSDSPSPSVSVEDRHTPLLSRASSQGSSTASSSPGHRHGDVDHRDVLVDNSSRDRDDFLLTCPIVKPPDRLSSGQAPPPGFPASFLFANGISSVETLLTNIQGLLKVAVENARVQNQQTQTEKQELKVELYREREMRESLERQLTMELQSRASIQKRLKKEKKLKRKLQEALEVESKRRARVEDTLKHSSIPLVPPSTAHCTSKDVILQEDIILKEKPEINSTLQRSPFVQESCVILKTNKLF
ncbi:hypothetical protein UPYG_G00245140 [Umbra pygmaea]|uniref:SKI/SNO/DAC domain-containing protein n=1 Tax=Umbra pygmaea TaxID=75934 RepID=A0ABD0WL68_UMBPY